MKLSSATSWILSIVSASVVGSSYAQDEVAGMTKMCLFYPNPSGHARSDPILNQVCPADHVHTFYGPENIHPSTTYADLRNTKPQYSSTPWIENQSLYWHPSIYQVTDASNGQKTYTRVNALESSPYYRWNTSTSPETVEFPASFRMIAYSDQVNAGMGGETSQNLFVECCNNVSVGEEEDCTTISMGNPLVFPTRTCDHLGIAMAMPTCWDESKGIGDNGDPFSHVAFTTDGNVGGPCPAGYNKRLPQVQLFVRIADYQGGTYQLSDGNDRWHVDFMNGWRPNKLQEIINDCAPSGEPGYNPPCDCNEQFLTENTQASEVVCDNDVKRFIVNEETAVVSTLPRGTCQGAPLILKSWNADPPFGQCLAVPPGPAPSTNPPSPNPTPQTSTSPTGTLPTTIISKGDSFVYDLPGTQSTYDKQVIFIDLFDTNKKDIASIRSMGKVVICYFSAGSFEDWRSDKSAFPINAVGNPLGEWPGEFWLDIMNDDVRTIMKARMDLAKNKGCHGVDPDNVDGFDNDTGFSILKWQTKDYLQFLASQAHERGLLIGLKNSAEIATQVEQYFDFAVVEECWEYNECCQYISFGTQMKPVFAIEYRSVKQKLCAKFENNGFSTNFANYALDQIWFCPEETRHLDAAVSDKESSRKLAFCSK